MPPVLKGDVPETYVVILPKCVENSTLTVFQLPHPSNNRSKGPVRLFIHEGLVYQLQTQKFSRGCAYNSVDDEVNDRYHYTADGQAYKSAIYLNEDDPSQSLVLESGEFDYHTKYDLAFSLCRYYYRNNVVDTEAECLEPSRQAVKPSSNFLTVRDFHDELVSVDSPNWSHVPLEVLEAALLRVSDVVEEAGDRYFRLSPQRITKWLSTKVERILPVFPSSLPLPTGIPEEYLLDIKTAWSTNLLLSLLPQLAYWELRNYEGDNLNIKRAFVRQEQYKSEVLEKQKENDILIKSAMSVGFQQDAKREGPPRQTTNLKSTVKKKVAIGKGAIDSFFKKR
ncbi:AaceriAAL125Wp [[Ashbya] aceris (nom. inval.)]|nr:AaceriAAL125Wp [[Ashbya] aceris (nom. inval.)]